MENVNSDEFSTNVNDEYKNLAKNSFYSLLIQYSTIIYSILTSIFMARLISKELWGLLILATAIIMIIALITFFLPPALEYSILYYVPRYILSNQQTKLKSFLKKGLIIKIFVVTIIFFLGIFISIIIINLINFSQKDQLISILYFISPLIFVYGLTPILNSINQGFNDFKIIFFLFIVKAFFNISALLFTFLFIKHVKIELIALINLISELIPFIINFLIIIKKFLQVEDTGEKSLKYKEFNQMTLKYGLPVSFNYLEYTLWNQLQIIGIASLDQPEYILGYNISLSYSNVAKNACSSLHTPLTTSFSRLGVSNNFELIIAIYNLIIKYSLFLLLLFTGLMLYIADFYLVIIYGSSYLDFSLFLKIMIISIIFRILITPFDSVLYAQNRTRFLPPIRIVMLIIQVSVFFVGLIYFGIYGALLAIFIINILLFFLFIILNFKTLKIKINLKKIFLQYLTFFVSIVITALLEIFIYRDVYTRFIQLLNLGVLEFLPLFSIITFLVLFFILNIVFRIFSNRDIEILDSFLNKDSKIMRFFRKRFKFLKKIIRIFE